MVNIKFRATNTSEKKKWGNSIREEHTVVFICIFFKPNGVYLWFFYYYHCIENVFVYDYYNTFIIVMLFINII